LSQDSQRRESFRELLLNSDPTNTIKDSVLSSSLLGLPQDSFILCTILHGGEMAAVLPAFTRYSNSSRKRRTAGVQRLLPKKQESSQEPQKISP
jgi:hypothetical protein